ncbi:MAG: DUF3363 domain-containing protein [Hyphomonadaceae bacterium]|nr:DUF3363 domain-containing protein [Hyphomonadaceae bacterium]
MDADIDDRDFEPRVGRVAREKGSSLVKLRAAVRIAARVGGGRKAPAVRTGPRAHFAKGAAAKAKATAVGQRRVVVKARYVAHGGGKGAPLRVHVSYLAREPKAAAKVVGDDTVTARADELGRSVDYLKREDGAQTPFSFYNQRETDIDAKTMTAAWAGDTRHFRLIISAEDGEALGDLRPFIREIMEGLERQVGTRLDWVAVDHHDTDNPHTHVLIRGKRADGQDLFIPSKVLSAGIREHAQEIVTRVLGPRQVIDLAHGRQRDIATRGVTPLDRELVEQARNAGVAVTRPDLAARLEKLEAWGLAVRRADGWRLADDLFGKLTSMEAHAAVEQAVSGLRRGGDARQLLAAHPDAPVVGELRHFGPADDLGDTFLAVVENERGELRYASFDRADDLAHLTDASVGAVIIFEPKEIRVRAADEAVARIAKQLGGIYSVERHASVAPNVSHGLLAANVRRLEAMRRAGLVERSRDGVFHIADDHLSRALEFETRLAKGSPLSARVQSYWTLSEQVGALGPTQLDRVLAGAAHEPVGQGAFARRHAAALQQRRLFLIEQGWLGKDEQVLSQSSLNRMAQSELRQTASRLSRELGRPILTHVPAEVRGVYAQRIDLAQGRVALILHDRQGLVVPWRAALERFAGREVTGVMRGQTLSWSLGRTLGPDLPPM